MMQEMEEPLVAKKKKGEEENGNCGQQKRIATSKKKGKRLRGSAYHSFAGHLMEHESDFSAYYKSETVDEFLSGFGPVMKFVIKIMTLPQLSWAWFNIFLVVFFFCTGFYVVFGVNASIEQPTDITDVIILNTFAFLLNVMYSANLWFGHMFLSKIESFPAIPKPADALLVEIEETAARSLVWKALCLWFIAFSIQVSALIAAAVLEKKVSGAALIAVCVLSPIRFGATLMTMVITLLLYCRTADRLQILLQSSMGDPVDGALLHNLCDMAQAASRRLALGILSLLFASIFLLAFITMTVLRASDELRQSLFFFAVLHFLPVLYSLSFGILCTYKASQVHHVGTHLLERVWDDFSVSENQNELLPLATFIAGYVRDNLHLSHYGVVFDGSIFSRVLSVVLTLLSLSVTFALNSSTAF
eukprot:ANDGO_02234.mRNA.1 hypothetical protein